MINLHIVYIIFRKEIVDTFRDRRALIAMVIVPILLYPALFLCLSQVAIIQTTSIDRAWSQVALIGDETGLVKNWVELIPKIEVVDVDDPRGALLKGLVDAVVWVAEGAPTDLIAGRTVEIVVEYDATETPSQRAASRVLEGLAKEKGRLLQQRLKQANIHPEFIVPINVEKKNVASPTKVTGSLLGMVIPVIMVLMLGVGAFYPAVDLTAGEKERGTFETLLSVPVNRIDLVGGKFLAVFTLSMMTALLNLGSMVATFSFQFSQLSEELQANLTIHFSLLNIVLMVVFLIPLAFFICAVMMSLAVLARSFREAQSYIMPFFIIIMFPAAIAGLPGMTLNSATQLLPITNMALLFKEMMKGGTSADAAFVVIMSTGTYALLALVLAAWIFQREELMLADGRGASMSWWRKDLTPRSAMPVSLALLVFCACLLLIFYVGSFFQLRWPFKGLLLTQWGLILFPSLFVAWYTKARFSEVFLLKKPRFGEIVWTVFIAIGWAFLSLQLAAWLNRIFPMPEELSDELEWVLERVLIGRGYSGLYFAVALSPAICEEMLFRGLLLTSFRRYLHGWALCSIIGLLFAIIHLNVYKLFPVMLSGIFLTYIVWRTGSIFLGMIAHLIINSIGLWVGVGPAPQYLKLFFAVQLTEGRSLPWEILLSAAVIFFTGLIFLQKNSFKNEPINSEL